MPDSAISINSDTDSEISYRKHNSLKDDTLTISTTISTTESSSYPDDNDNSFEDLDRLIHERHIKVTNCEAHFEDSEPDQSKLKTLLSLLKNLIGVKDIVSLRISLPSQLLEPIGNLEYWNYNDRPDFLACIDDSDDPLERMFATIRWWYSKDLKFVKGKLIKPYNSILGEQFICHWNVAAPKFDKNGHYINNDETSSKNYLVTCLNEQISHHPPVSAFHYNCEETGVSAYGIDQISAKFTGTTVKIGPGDQNKGIYINLAKRDNEEYLLTHPVASVQGWLKASLYITVGESCIVTCPKTKLKAILEYKDERWIGKPKFAIEGKIFRYDPNNDDIKKLKSVDDKDVVAEIYGSWRGQVHATRLDNKKTNLIVDLSELAPVPKIVKPIAKQGPLESRRVWRSVSAALFQKDYSKATKEKVAIEDRQRQLAAEAKTRKEEFDSVYFKLPVADGRPELKDKAYQVLQNVNL
ncbi:oxysterol-binding protein [Gigaspora rosea]|uniref:Oxysterol-binding protein n=1 Tax=Gigaspora rosea TaxID=44941 RepID=A0A397UJ92_9GLOM|nr:oxysterol-binding protein [Gigaspora rosea]